VVIDEAAAKDPAVIAFRNKVTVIGDGTSGAPTVVEMILTDGRQLTAARDVTTPDPNLSALRPRLRDKFRTITAPHLAAGHAEALIAAVERPPAEVKVSSLTQLANGWL
jgi:hypothetical protein